MEIRSQDIDRMEEAGTLHGESVKLIRTTGGWWIALGRKKPSGKQEALEAGSHPAIVKYNMERKFPEFQPVMMKSEGHADAIVEKHSHFLSEDLRKSGHDIYSLQTGGEVEFQVTKHNAQVASVTGFFDKEHLMIETLNIPKELTKALAGASVEKAISMKAGLKMRK
jgi:hypothetical protein